MMSSRLFSAVPQAGDPHLTADMLNWSNNPYTADPRPVNFVPLIVAPIAQQPGDEAQPAGGDQPTDDTTADSSSSSSLDRRSPAPQSTADDTTSGNTETVHLTSSGPSSESPLITRPSPQ